MGSGGSEGCAKKGQFVRIELAGKDRILHVAEVQAFVGRRMSHLKVMQNRAPLVMEVLRNLRLMEIQTVTFHNSKSVTHNANGDAEAWWEVDLGKEHDLTKLVVWNRTDSGLQPRLDGFRLQVLNSDREIVWEKTFSKAPKKRNGCIFGRCASRSICESQCHF